MNPPTDAPDVVHLALRVDDLAAGLAQLTSDVEGLAAAVLPAELTLPDDDPPPGRASAAPSDSVYDELDTWVEEYFLPTFRRPIGGEYRWCSRWQEHPEALTRLEALWRSWEALRLDPNLGIATWLTAYLDPLLAVQV